MELNEYWTVCREIQEAEEVDVLHFADARRSPSPPLGERAGVRWRSQLSTINPQLPAARSLQHNLWVFGPEYSLMASNEQLQSIIRDYTHQQYQEPDAKDRPDLFLAGNILKQHLLVEFKRPSDAVGRDAEAQAKKYADTLTGRLGMSLQILIIGGEVDPKLQDEYTGLYQ